MCLCLCASRAHAHAARRGRPPQTMHTLSQSPLSLVFLNSFSRPHKCISCRVSTTTPTDHDRPRHNTHRETSTLPLRRLDSYGLPPSTTSATPAPLHAICAQEYQEVRSMAWRGMGWIEAYSVQFGASNDNTRYSQQGYCAPTPLPAACALVLLLLGRRAGPSWHSIRQSSSHHGHTTKYVLHMCLLHGSSSSLSFARLCELEHCCWTSSPSHILTSSQLHTHTHTVARSCDPCCDVRCTMCRTKCSAAQCTSTAARSGR